jgi:hypothetical protein
MSFSRRRLHFAAISGLALFFLLSLSLGVTNTSVFAAPRASHLSSSHAQASKAAAATNTAVTTYKEDNSRSGNHTTETTLNTSNVNQSSFGKRVSYPLDGQSYTQPLYLPNLTIGGASHNVVYVTTEHDSVYAFDADQTSATAPLWHVNFLNPPSVVSPSNTDVTCNDMVPEDGLSGTPVIDRNTGTLYVVVMTKEGTNFIYRLHALDVETGKEKAGSPVQISATVSGTGAGNVGGKITFNAKTERQRASLVFANNNVYIAWGSFCDTDPYHGWIMSYSYNGSQFTQTAVYNATPTGSRGGIWGAGGALSADSNGNIYYVSGNGDFSANTGGANYGDSFVRLNSKLQVQDYFAPFNQQCLKDEDADLGSGGALLVPSMNRIIGAGKEGRIYVLNMQNLGHYNTVTNPCNNQTPTNIDKIVQELPPSTIGGLYSNAAYWKKSTGQQYVYFAGANDSAKMFALNSNGTLSTAPLSKTPQTFGFTGGNPTVSSNNGAAGTGIVWTLDPTPALRAYDATDLTKQLYSTTLNSARDGLDSYVKFSTSTVANGEVFVPTKTVLNIYGLTSTSGTTPTPTTPTPTSTASPTPTPTAYNNVGTSNDNATTAANFDNAGNSYSAQALGADGISAGGLVNSDGISYTWPGTSPGTANDYQASGQKINIAPVANADHLGFLGSAANGASSGTATITYADSSTQQVTLGFTDWATATPSFGNSLVAVMTYRNTKSGQQTLPNYLFSATFALQDGKTVQSVTLPATTTGGQLHVFAVGTSSLKAPIYNNVGITDDGTMNPGFDSDNGNIAPGNYDGGYRSYSAQALQADGITPGWSITNNSITYTWPNVAASEAENYLANGQTLAVSPVSQANTLGLLGSAVNGAASGTATITYTDGSTKSFTLGFTDWTTKTLSFGNSIVATMPYRDMYNGGRQTITTYLFSTSVPVDPTRTVQSVTLPATTTGGQIHVFAVGTSSSTAPIYNNVGITDNNNVVPGNFDGAGNSYSAQALQAAGLNAGDNSFDPTRTVTFTWPGVPAGTADNYLTTGQVIPITPAPNATILAFLGSAANGATSGTATITYTDGTTQTFPLGFSDWTLNGGKVQPSFSNKISYTASYRSNPRAAGGRENLKSYVFYASYTLPSNGKTIQSVTLPSTVTGGQMHVFAITTK